MLKIYITGRYVDGFLNFRKRSLAQDTTKEVIADAFLMLELDDGINIQRRFTVRPCLYIPIKIWYKNIPWQVPTWLSASVTLVSGDVRI